MKTEEAKEIDKVQNRVVIYPIPVGAAKQRDYIVKVRPLGEEQWKEVGCYQVNTESRTAVKKNFACQILWFMVRYLLSG